MMCIYNSRLYRNEQMKRDKIQPNRFPRQHIFTDKTSKVNTNDKPLGSHRDNGRLYAKDVTVRPEYFISSFSL
jgi:hypothetical protein